MNRILPFLVFLLLSAPAWADGIVNGGSSSIVVGTTPIVGGVDDCVLYETGTSVVGCDSGFTYAGSNGKVTAAGLIGSSSAGSATAPSVYVGNSTTGFFSVSTTGWGLSVNGVDKFDYGYANSAAFTFGPSVFFAGYVQSNLLFSYSSSTITVGSSVGAGTAFTLSLGGNATGTNIASNNTTVIGQLSTGTGTDGDIIFQTGVKNGGSNSTPATPTTAMTIKGETQQVNFAAGIQAVLSNTATTSAVCYNVGTGLFSYDGTIGTCTVSALWHKNLLGVLNLADDPLSVLRPIVYTYKHDVEGIGDERIHVGLAADDVAVMDARCVVYDKEGRLSNYEDRCVLAYLVADRAKLKAEFDSYKRTHL